MTEEKFPKEFSLEISSGEKKNIVHVGPSTWGQIYREDSGSYYYRIIPIENIRDAEKRDLIKQQIGKTRRRSIAPIVDSAMRDKNGQVYFFIRYEIRPNLTWPSVMENSDAKVKLASALPIIRSFPFWWESVYEGFIPMPADIVFVGKDPFLLSIPVFLGYPRIASFFSIPERILYTAPEILQGQSSQIRGKNLDIYSFGAALMQCLYTVQYNREAGHLLARSASGTLFAAINKGKKLPLWTDKVDPVQEIFQIIHKSVEPDISIRHSVDPEILAQTIEKNIKYLDPGKAVENLRKKGEAQKAFSLLQDIFLSDATPDLLLTAGLIAKEDLKRPLEAIQYFERSITKSPIKTEAFEQQLRLLLKKEILALLALQIEKRFTVSEKLDNMIWRDFYGISVRIQKELALECARYFLWRKKYEKAAKLLYNFLFEGKKFLWWEFPKCLAYAEALIGMKRIDEARKFLSDIKNKLLEMKREKKMDAGKIHEYGGDLTRLEALLLEHTHKKTSVKKDIN
jgi:tetratricopeptide (TPR) repeat protein